MQDIRNIAIIAHVDHGKTTLVDKLMLAGNLLKEQDNTDTGSAESQIALFSYRIAHLTEHLKANRKDYSTQRALTMLVGKRRSLLKYLKDRDIERYRAIVAKLGLRR